MTRELIINDETKKAEIARLESFTNRKITTKEYDEYMTIFTHSLNDEELKVFQSAALDIDNGIITEECAIEMIENIEPFIESIMKKTIIALQVSGLIGDVSELIEHMME